MSYDYADVRHISGHHTNCIILLMIRTVFCGQIHRAFMAAGVPARKIVIGIAFYGKGWKMQSDDNNGLYRRAQQPARGGGFTYLKDSLINKNGFIRYWDDKGNAPYLLTRRKKFYFL